MSQQRTKREVDAAQFSNYLKSKGDIGFKRTQINRLDTSEEVGGLREGRRSEDEEDLY